MCTGRITVHIKRKNNSHEHAHIKRLTPSLCIQDESDMCVQGRMTHAYIHTRRCNPTLERHGTICVNTGKIHTSEHRNSRT